MYNNLVYDQGKAKYFHLIEQENINFIRNILADKNIE